MHWNKFTGIRRHDDLEEMSRRHHLLQHTNHADLLESAWCISKDMTKTTLALHTWVFDRLLTCCSFSKKNVSW